MLTAHHAFAATMSVSPSSGSYTVGQTITVSIRANTSGSAANTAEANVTYSTNTLDLTKVSQGSTFYLPAPGSPSKGVGTAYVGGGLPTPGYNGTAGVVGTLTFIAKAQGSAFVNISSGKVLLNDGLGTDALTSTSGAKFTIGPPAVGGVVVSSDTDPDPTLWYNDADVNLSWSRPDGAYGFSFILDQTANTVPDNTLDTTVTTSKTYDSLKDGTWYFHIKARRQDQTTFGPTVTFQINIDTMAPQAFDTKLVGEDPATLINQTPTVSFTSSDSGSGLDSYAIFLDGHLYRENAVSPFTFDRLPGGSHVIQVSAKDKAGNVTQSQLPIRVKNGPGVLSVLYKNVTVPVYWIVIFVFGLLILLVFLILALVRRRRGTSPEPEIKQIQADIDESLENLKAEISQKLLGLSAKSSEELFAKETAAAKELRSGIVKTRKKIDGKISRIRKNSRKSKNETSTPE
ncbi:MAG TPA: hypothetical protein VFX17_00030 [Patescibacteria group bacterium]|nr:hypothetical protein [Patescibacteria group bacterium]